MTEKNYFRSLEFKMSYPLLQEIVNIPFRHFIIYLCIPVFKVIFLLSYYIAIKVGYFTFPFNEATHRNEGQLWIKCDISISVGKCEKFSTCFVFI